jgi:hypothetical protein
MMRERNLGGRILSAIAMLAQPEVKPQYYCNNLSYYPKGIGRTNTSSSWLVEHV